MPEDPRNPDWRSLLRQCAAVGHKGFELGPFGYMPDDPSILSDALVEHDLKLIDGVVLRPYHDASAWEDVHDAAHRNCKVLRAHGAEAEPMDRAERVAFRGRLAESAKIGSGDYRFTVGVHAPAAGLVDLFLTRAGTALG